MKSIFRPILFCFFLLLFYSSCILTAKEHNLVAKNEPLHLDLSIDLIIENIKLEPFNMDIKELYVGKAANFSFTMKDIISNSIINSQYAVAVYLSQDAVLNTKEDLLLKEVRFNNLTTEFPFITKTGTYTIFFVADSKNEVVESNEINNVSAINVRINQLTIDFSAAGLSGSLATAAPGDSLFVSYFLATSQKSALESYFYTFNGIYLSKDSIFNPGTDLILKKDSLYHNYYEDGTNHTKIKHSVKIPDTLQYGTYYLIAVADPDNYFLELNKRNNVSISKISIRPVIDVKIDTIYCSYDTVVNYKERILNRNVRGTLIVKNYSLRKGSSTVITHIYLSKNKVVSNSDTLISTSEISLDNGQVKEIDFVLPEKLAVEEGDYYLIADLKIKRDTLLLLTEEHYPVKKIYIRSYDGDLQPTDVTIDQSKYFINSTLSINYKIANTGSDYAQGISYTGFFISEDSLLSSDDKGTYSPNLFRINGFSKESTFPRSITINNLIPGKKYYSIIHCNNPTNSSGHIEEKNYNNNTIIIPFYINKTNITAASNFSVPSDNISVYPNPVSNILTIALTTNTTLNGHVYFYNRLGNIVLEFDMKGKHHLSEVDFAIESLIDGAYTLKIETTAGIVYKKIVKN